MVSQSLGSGGVPPNSLVQYNLHGTSDSSLTRRSNGCAFWRSPAIGAGMAVTHKIKAETKNNMGICMI
jgi:hypothetical protein